MARLASKPQMSEPISPSASTIEYLPPGPVYVVLPYRPRYWLHALLLLGTVFTTLVVGARMQDNFLHNLPAFYTTGDSFWSFFSVGWALQGSHLLLGVPFSFTLMLILLAHEMGHYLCCRYYRVSATLPFFIPVPTLIGTLGAFIRIRAPIRSRTELFDIGIAGPILGFAVAVPVLVVALSLSKAVPAVTASAYELDYPLIFGAVYRALASAGLVHGTGVLGTGVRPFDHLLLHPMAIAAWVGMFATALNLLPGGQLDGGHIVFAIAPRSHHIVSRITIAALVVMSYYFSTTWLVWAILLRITGMRHPVVSDWPGIEGWRRWLAAFALLMLVLTFTPAPFAHTSLREIFQ